MKDREHNKEKDGQEGIGRETECICKFTQAN